MNKPHLRFRITKGNLKLPKTTYIFNMTTVQDCPALKLGLCSLGTQGSCYAMKPYRNTNGEINRQMALYWALCGAEDFVRSLDRIDRLARQHRLKQLRFNESGDFLSQDCVDKAEHIAEILGRRGIPVYAYTHRRDLNYRNCRHLVVNASSEDGSDDWGLEQGLNVFRCTTDPPNNGILCPGDCRKCSLCTKHHGKIVHVNKH